MSFVVDVEDRAPERRSIEDAAVTALNNSLKPVLREAFVTIDAELRLRAESALYAYVAFFISHILTFLLFTPRALLRRDGASARVVYVRIHRCADSSFCATRRDIRS